MGLRQRGCCKPTQRAVCAHSGIYERLSDEVSEPLPPSPVSAARTFARAGKEEHTLKPDLAPLLHATVGKDALGAAALKEIGQSHHVLRSSSAWKMSVSRIPLTLQTPSSPFPPTLSAQAFALKLHGNKRSNPKGTNSHVFSPPHPLPALHHTCLLS